MVEFWLDTNSFITPKRGPYGFDIVPGFWKFLDRKAKDGIIASSVFVYEELRNGEEDDLLEWAKRIRESGFFVEPDASVQAAFREIADHVENTYEAPQASQFLAGADPWIIAHAKANSGRVVTFEVGAPRSKKPKIPDVGDRFGVRTLNMFQLLRLLGASFG